MSYRAFSKYKRSFKMTVEEIYDDIVTGEEEFIKLVKSMK